MSSSVENIQKLLVQVAPSAARYYEYIMQPPSWNIFYALGGSKYRDELIHSYFLATLLRTKIDGNFIFLQLFLDLLHKKFHYNYTPADLLKSPNIKTEYNIGYITKDYMDGGRIDILIEMPGETIVIENKVIAAGDQPKQLYRYFKQFPKARLLYLTLTGRPPTEGSIDQLENEGGSYDCISYKQDILSWIKSCREVLGQPNQMQSQWNKQLEMNLSQYQEILENLTNEGAKKIMNEEVIKIANANENNFMSALHIGRNYNEIFNQTIREKLINPLREFIQKQYGTDFEIREQTADIISGILIYKPSWKQITLRLNSEQWGGFTSLYGLSKINKKVILSNNLTNYFNQDKFSSYKRTFMWPLIGELSYRLSEESTAIKLWNSKTQTEIIEHFKEKITELMDILQQAQKDGIEL